MVPALRLSSHSRKEKLSVAQSLSTPLLEIPAAIKVLHVQMGPERQEAFRREARTIAHLQHPHIVRVLEFGVQDQTPFLVMEYAQGCTLRTLHPRGTRLPLEQIVTYVSSLPRP